MLKNKKISSKVLYIVLIIGALVYLLWGINERNFEYVIKLRSKKLLAVALVSYAIGYSTTAFQTITANKILTPSVMGLDSLYMFVQTGIVFFLQGQELKAMEGNLNFLVSLVIMIGFSSILYLGVFRKNIKNVYFLVLVGMIFGTLFGGMADFMQVILDPNEFLVLQGKMFASFGNINTGLLGVSTLICIAIHFYTKKDYSKLDVISVGIEHAINLGVNYKQIVIKNLMIISILISISTVLVGPLTFLGIMVISLARMITKTYKHNELINASFCVGASALIWGLILVERIFNMGVSLGMIINFVGGIYFIYAIIKESNHDTL